MSEEIWKKIEGLADDVHYEVSNLGRVRRNYAPRHQPRKEKLHILSLRPGSNLYLRVQMRTGKSMRTRKDKQVHRLVASAFVPNPHNKPHVNHKDSNRQNNHVSNLEWVTHKENMQHALKTGRLNESIKKMSARSIGINNPKCKLTEDEVRFIRACKDGGSNMADVARVFGISTTQANLIGNRKFWKHVKEL